MATHPVQYATPIFRLLAKDPRIEIQVAYCNMQGSEPQLDPDFGIEVKWDIPLLDGYPWLCLPNRSRKPRLGSFFGLFNPRIWRLIRAGNFDAVVLYTGYAYATAWIAIAAAKVSGIPLLLASDAASFQPRNRRAWKKFVKKLLLPSIYRLADVVITVSEAGRQFMLSMGIPESRVILTPFVVDNTWWQQRASEVDRCTIRRAWNIPEDAIVVLFCAKLQPWKRPGDVLCAFAEANVKGTYLVYAGEGSLRASLEAKARSLGVSERTRFLGFVNQASLPPVYRSSDLFVMPSEYDPCPTVVCEAMLCGCPVILSDAVRGRFDLVKDGVTGFIYPCGDIGALAKVLSNALSNPERLKQLGSAALARMETWSPRENVEATVQAIERGIRLGSSAANESCA